MASGLGYRAVIDGYNVIKQDSQLARLSLAAAREQLLVLVQQTRWPVPVSRVDLIFDSARAPDFPVSRRASVYVSFATPSADAAIQDIIQTSSQPDRLLIISNDRAILHTAQRHGTHRYAVAWLLLRSRPGTQPSAKQPKPKALTSSEARRITDELKQRFGFENG